MKINTYAYLSLAIYSAVIYIACNKIVRQDDKPNVPVNAPPSNDSTNFIKTPQITADSTFNGDNLGVNSSTCTNAPNYGDSIVYLKPKSSGDFFVNPVNNAGVDGAYFSWPEGLSLNRYTGAINLSQSETGVRYNIAFVKKGTTDTCVSQLIVGGLTYLDAVYDLSQGDTLAMPVFNADPLGSSVCDPSDDTDYPDNNSNGNNKCVFDDGLPGQRANDQKLRVRTTSGIINLKKSVEDGLFGQSPRNGASKMVQIRYRLNDESLKADQKITVQVVYYDNVLNIPTATQQEIAGKRANMFTYKIVKGKPRPPYLVIAGLKK